MAVQIYPGLPFSYLLLINPESSVDSIRRQLEYSALQDQKHFIDHPDGPEQANIDQLKERVRITTEAVGSEPGRDIIYRLTYLSEELWDQLSARPDVLKLFLNSKKTTLPLVAFTFPDAILTNEKLCEYALPDALRDSPDLMQSALDVIEFYEERGSSVRERVKSSIGDSTWMTLVTAYRGQPWLFTPESQSVIDRLALDNFSPLTTLTQEEWSGFMQDSTHYLFQWSNELSECIEAWRQGAPVLTAQEIAQLQHYVDGIPWKEAKAFAERLRAGEDVKSIVAGKDGGDQYTDQEWKRARREYFMKRVVDVAPGVAKLNLSVSLMENVSQLPHGVLRSLERFAVQAPDMHELDNVRLDNLIFVAAHDRSTEVLYLLSLSRSYTYNIINGSSDAVRRFCDDMTMEVVDRLRAWPENVVLDVLYAPEFFADPRADQVLEFVAELRAIHGDSFHIWMSELLMFDIQIDRTNLQQLQDNSGLPVTDGNLGRLRVATEGSMRETLDKVLAMGQGNSKVDFSNVREQLQSLTPRLARHVIQEIADGSIGWSILDHREELVRDFGYTDDDFAQLVYSLYRSDSKSMPAVDAGTATVLLTEPGKDDDSMASRFKNIRPVYKGNILDLFALVRDRPGVVVSLVSLGWDSIPKEFKQQKAFWEILREGDVSRFLEHYEEHDKSVPITEEVISKIISVGTPAEVNILFGFAKTGEIALSDEQQGDLALRYVGEGQIDPWFEDAEKSELLQKQFAAIVRGWKASPEDSRQLLGAFTEAGVISSADVEITRSCSAVTELKLLSAILRWKGNGMSNLNQELDGAVGERILYLSERPQVNFSSVVRSMVRQEFSLLDKQEVPEDGIAINETNWLPLVMAYVRTTIDDHQIPKPGNDTTERVTNMFKRTDVKDYCLSRLQELWQEYLDADQPERMSGRLLVLTGFIDDCEGAGPMSQFEALSLFIHSVRWALAKPKTVDRTKGELVRGLATMENRFGREGWSNDTKANFYNVSRDITEAAPSVAAEFMQAFEALSPSELGRFQAEVYPLVRAWLAVQGKSGKNGTLVHNPRELVLGRRSIREFAATAKEATVAKEAAVAEKKDGAAKIAEEEQKTQGAIQSLREHVIGELKVRFKERFGITNIPEQFTAEHVHALTNMSLYLANLAKRTPQNEQMLGWYLALMVNDKWDAFRRGEDINPEDYIESAKATAIAEVMKRRKEYSPITAKRLNIAEEEVAEFQAILQQETAQIAIGDIETIDVKLGNVITNLRTLLDPDLYTDGVDKMRIDLLVEFGNKLLGRVAAKMHQSISMPEREIKFSDEEIAVRARVEEALTAEGIELSADNIKTSFQSGMKALSLVAGVVRYVEEVHAEDDINQVRTLLKPSEEIVAIFNRLDEEFTQASGALALTQDLDYLENIIVKREDELDPDEMELLRGYVNSVRAQVITLQNTYDQVKAKFSAMSKANHDTDNALLSERLGQISHIINTKEVQQTVTSTLTHNMNAIIENIRACLSCKTAGCNNDTDLTFGDSNKFFIYSNTEAQAKGSIADQIVYIEPVTHSDGRQEMSLVFDTMYGSCTPFILTNHIRAAAKKLQLIKKRFPESTISLFVTGASMRTSGVSAEMLGDRLKAELGNDVEIVSSTDAEVDVVQSAAGDHYVEFGGDVRTVGKRTVSGLVVRV